MNAQTKATPLERTDRLVEKPPLVPFLIAAAALVIIGAIRMAFFVPAH